MRRLQCPDDVAEWGSGGEFEGNPWGLMGSLSKQTPWRSQSLFFTRPQTAPGLWFLVNPRPTARDDHGIFNHLFDIALVKTPARAQVF